MIFPNYVKTFKTSFNKYSIKELCSIKKILEVISENLSIKMILISLKINYILKVSMYLFMFS